MTTNTPSRPSRNEQKRRAREQRLAEEAQARARAERARRTRRLGLGVAATVGLAVLALGAVFAFNGSGGPSPRNGGSGGKLAYDVGDPGPGSAAPAIRLPGTSGGTFDLAAQRGKTVMLYFQEGVGCQPCWDQIRDLEAQRGRLAALGIDKVASVTTDPLGALEQKVRDERLSTPVLSDPSLAVSRSYNANQYGMMGTSRDGHSFVVVGPDGRIKFRADYGGSPNYTMYVPMRTLLVDLRKGLRGRT